MMLRSGILNSTTSPIKESVRLAQKDAEIAQLKAKQAELTNTVVALLDKLNSILQDGVKVEPQYESMLLRAAQSGNMEQVRLALTGGANIKTYDVEGKSALHLAVMNKHQDVIEYLINNYPTLFMYKAEVSYTPIQQVASMATSIDQLDQLAWLYDKGKIVSEFVNNQIAFNKLYEVATPEAKLFLANKKLLEAAAAAAATADTVLVIKDAIEKGANLNIKEANGETALHKAVSLQHMAIVTLLLEKGADPTIHDNKVQDSIGAEHKTPLEIAIEKKNDELITLLASPFLIHTVVHGNQAGIRFALSVGAKLQCVDAQGQMALHKAAIAGRQEIIDILLQEHAARKVDIYIPDKAGNTPLQLAAKSGHIVVTEEGNQTLDIYIPETYAVYKHIVKTNEKALKEKTRDRIQQTALATNSFVAGIGQSIALTPVPHPH